MADLLMPKATAVWLVENTALSFQQIAEFTGLHELEVQAIADGEGAAVVAQNPIQAGQLTQAEIERCQADPQERLTAVSRDDLPQPKRRVKGPRYTPVSKRADKPDGIAYLLRHHPNLTETQIMRLLGTTKQTIGAVRNRTHADSATIKPRHPVLLGLCSQRDFEEVTGVSPTLTGYPVADEETAEP